MDRLILLLIVLFPMTIYANELPQIRKDFYLAIKNGTASGKFYNRLKAKISSDPTIMAYFGTSQAIRAKHAFNPYNKITYLKSGIKTLEKAVGKSPENLEIRFLRFSLEHY